MKFKSLLLLVGFIPALAMAEVAKPTVPEKPPAVVVKPVVVKPVVGATHVYHYHYHYGNQHHHGPHYYEWYPQFFYHGMYQSGPPQISGKPPMEGGAREDGANNAGGVKYLPGQMVPGHWGSPPNHRGEDVYDYPHIYIPWVPPKVEP